MSVMAAVGPAAAAAASYGQPLCGGGARKRKDADVVQDQDQEAGSSSLRGGKNAALFVLETVEEEADADTERSSIGVASEDGDDEEEEEEEEEVGSGGTKGAGAALACMDMGALDDALPIKRGLSNFFSGKSRSFVANLRDAASAGSSARGLAKPENPFNKRRRVLRYCATRWRPARPPRSPPPPPTK